MNYYTIQRQNIIYRALDSYTHPSDFPLLKCAHFIRVLYENQDFRQYYRAIPTTEELRERLSNLLVQAVAEDERQVIDEIYDIAIAVNADIPHVGDQEREYRRYLHQAPAFGDKDKFSLRSIASDRQNVHHSAINNSVKSVAKHICEDYPVAYNLFPVIFNKLPSRKKWTIENKDTLRFIQENPTQFGIGVSLKDILFSLFMWISKQPTERREDLYERLNEELYDMNKTCSTGHMARLVNIFQGFTDNPRYLVSIDIPKEIKRQIFSTLTIALKTADEDVIEGIVDKTPAYVAFMKNQSHTRRSEWLEEFGEEHADLIDSTIDAFIEG